MQALFVVLKQVDRVNDLIHALAEAGVHGGTIIDSTGMANALVEYDDLPFFGVLRHIVQDDGEKECSKTMFFVLEDEEIETVKGVIHKVIDLSKPNSGIIFAVPVTFVEGLGDKT
jgi:nitrogen regulatory protein PII